MGIGCLGDLTEPSGVTSNSLVAPREPHGGVKMLLGSAHLLRSLGVPVANTTLTAVAMNTLRRPKRSAIQPQKKAPGTAPRPEDSRTPSTVRRSDANPWG